MGNYFLNLLPGATWTNTDGTTHTMGGDDPDRILFQNEDLTIDRLNATYGLTQDELTNTSNPGFVFKQSGTMMSGDRVTVVFRKSDGSWSEAKHFQFDNFRDKTDRESAKKMQDWMREMVKIDKEFLGEMSTSRETYTGTESGEIYTPTDVEGPVSTEGGPVSTEGPGATTFRNTMSAGKQQRVNKFDVMGSKGGAGKADIFRGGRRIQTEVKAMGGFMTIDITGVEARGSDFTTFCSCIRLS